MCRMCIHFLKLYKLSACAFTHTHTNRGVHSLHKSAWTTCPIKSYPSPGWASDCKTEGWWLKEFINTRSNKVLWHNENYVGKEPSQMIVKPLKNMCVNGNLFAKLGLVSLSTVILCRLCSPTSPAVHPPNFTCLFDLWSFVMIFCSAVTSDILYTSKSKLLSSLVEILPACNPPPKNNNNNKKQLGNQKKSANLVNFHGHRNKENSDWVVSLIS